MVDPLKHTTPSWNWLPPVQNTEIYTWALFRLEEEKYWQIAWREYKQRRNLFQKGYKGQPNDVSLWQEIGKSLFQRMADPQLFIEQVFAYHLKQDRPRPPEVSELLGKLDTIGLWYDEAYRPDAESDLFIAGSKLEAMISRYPDTDPDYWFKKSPEDYPAYFHMLYRSTGELPQELAVKGIKEINYIHILRSIEKFEIWPIDAKERLTAARRHL